MKNLLCKIGIHKWVDLGQNMMLTDQVKQCSRCKLGKHLVNFGQAVFTYTPEAMKKAWLDKKINNSEAFRKIYCEEQ